ncbi:DUF445 family protein [Salipaludibacillus agaradhaerens]|uniref:DUF445 family protein n=1 Tax=Salipaludibacillus agaradhaerens TaxID=76935 RepID=A0A9Q4FXW8_SALAG|nr:DUF445 family protein [Salipaludibacillus agaradhaerens]MCR6097035.1 DUF445 family protein [Salipaludibacillus agaradhaerens]MCR6113480.1 DUF445 family protein [Salipaludibacillus agaradhaerens]
MSNVLLLGLLILIGAIVGGGTNIIAIRMLFRPYNAINVGTLRVPFTPGLIPKRREEIADKLGKTVEEHLLTPEGIQKQVKEGLLLSEFEERLTNAIEEFLKDERTLDEWLEMHVDKKDQMKRVRQAVENGLETRILSWIYEYEHRPFNEWVPQSWQHDLTRRIPGLSNKILKKAEEYLRSDEGTEQIEKMVGGFFESKGSFTGLMGKMAHRFSLSSIITKELIFFLQKDETERLLTELLENEWKVALAKPPSAFIASEKIEENIKAFSKGIVGHTPIVGEWEEPLNTWGHKYQPIMIDLILPSVMTTVSLILSRYLKAFIKKIGIKDIVTAEVNAFPIARLEDMLLMIAKRELKMIAILGAVIGGIVGFFQGIIVLFFI